jgi:hypothetical protein
VGNNPDPVPLVTSANEGSGYAMPFRVIPDLVKVLEDGFKSARQQCGDVFDDDELRLQFIDNPCILKP